VTRHVGTEPAGAGVRDACGGVELPHPAPVGSGGQTHQTSHSGYLCAGASDVLARFGKRGKFPRQMPLREVERRAKRREELQDRVCVDFTSFVLCHVLLRCRHLHQVVSCVTAEEMLPTFRSGLVHKGSIRQPVCESPTQQLCLSTD